MCTKKAKPRNIILPIPISSDAGRMSCIRVHGDEAMKLNQSIQAPTLSLERLDRAANKKGYTDRANRLTSESKKKQNKKQPNDHRTQEQLSRAAEDAPKRSYAQ